jgi:hypothetical protein
MKNFSLNIAWLAPLIVAGFALADVGTRISSSDGYALRPYEAAMRTDGTWPPFHAERRVQRGESHGDLAVLLARTKQGEAKQLTFTTNKQGFRATECSAPYTAVAFGTSETWGANLSDSETLPSVLSKLLGGCVYNAGSTSPPTPEQTEELAANLSFQGETVLYFFKERLGIPAPPASGAPESKTGPIARFFEPWANAIRLMKRAQPDHSPLAFWIRKEFRPLQDGLWLPNNNQKLIREKRLPDGRPMLFWHEEYEQVSSAVKVDPAFWTDMRDRFEARGARLVVVLVPHKLSVYGPLVGGAEAQIARANFKLSSIESALVDVGIPVINLRPYLQDLARENYPERLLFSSDDTHWNEYGASLAAHQIHRKLQAANWILSRRSTPGVQAYGSSGMSLPAGARTRRSSGESEGAIAMVKKASRQGMPASGSSGTNMQLSKSR